MQLKDFLQTINTSKENLIDQDQKVEKSYPPFLVNRCMSYFPDTIFAANQINQNAHADKKLQYDYMLYSVRSKKRFAPWEKKVNNEDLELIKQAYSVSEKKALEIMNLLDDEKMKIIQDSQFTGGHK